MSDMRRSFRILAAGLLLCAVRCVNNEVFSSRNTCTCASHQVLSLELSVGATGLWWDPLLVSFNAAIQHPGSSRSPSLLKDGWFSQMWMATFTSSSLAVLARSRSVIDIMTSVHTSFILALEKVRAPWPKRRQRQTCFSDAGIREPHLFSYVAVPRRSPHFILYLYFALTKTTTSNRMLLRNAFVVILDVTMSLYQIKVCVISQWLYSYVSSYDLFHVCTPIVIPHMIRVQESDGHFRVPKPGDNLHPTPCGCEHPPPDWCGSSVAKQVRVCRHSVVTPHTHNPPKS